MAADRTEAFPPPHPPGQPNAVSRADSTGDVTLLGPESTPPVAGPWPTVDGYEILCEIGRGGMGVVYKARQIGLNRLVALKMILAGGHASAAELARFRAEAEAIGRLQHPNIVHINEVGYSEGRPYFSLEYVDGGSLAHKLDGTPWPPAHAAQLIETLCLAMQAAHQAGIVHRDLKPANILLRKDEGGRFKDEKGEPSFLLHPSSFLPKITDFGLAKQMDSHIGQTQSGAILGTPSYMAPEQAGGKSKEIGPATDVYALGAIFYELLTGRPPFKAETPLDTVLQVVAEDPVPPRRLQPKLPRDLDTICLKCLEKPPAKRYAAAADLADDLSRWRQMQPIRARRIGRVGRSVRWCRRNPVLAAVVALAAGVIVTLSTVFYVSLVRENDRTLAALRQAMIEEDQGQDILAHSLFEQARAVRLSNESGRRWKALELLAQAEKLRDRKRLVELPPDQIEQPLLTKAEMRREAAAALLLEDARVSRQVPLPAVPGLSVSVSADGRHAMAWWARLQKNPPEIGTRLYDLLDGRILAEERLPLAMSLFTLSPDEKTVAYFSGDGNLQLRDFAKEGRTRSLGLPKEPAGMPPLKMMGRGLLFSPDGRYVVGFRADQSRSDLYLWDLQDPAASRHVARLEAIYPELAFRGDSKVLAYGIGEKKIALWDLSADGKTTEVELPLPIAGASPLYPKPNYPAALAQATTLAWSPGEPLLAVAATGTTGQGTILLWDMEAGKERSRWEGDFDPRQVLLAFSPDGKRLACGSSDGTIRCYHVGDRREILRLDAAHHDGIACLRWESPNSLLSAGMSNSFRAWEFSDGRLRLSVSCGMEPTGPIAYSPDGAWLAYRTGDAQARVILVENSSGTVRHSLELRHSVPKDPYFERILFRPDSGEVAWATKLGDAIAWNLSDGREIGRRNGDSDAQSQVGWLLPTFFPNGRLMTLVAHNGRFEYRDLFSGAESELRPQLSAIPLVDSGIQNLVHIGGNGRRLLGLPNESIPARRALPVWDLITGERADLGPLEDEVSGYTRVAVSPDGRRLLKICRPASFDASVGSSEPVLSMWNLDTRQRLWRIQRNVRPPARAFSADSRHVAIGYQNGFVELWDVERGEELFRWQPRGHGEIWGIAFSPDGTDIATSDGEAPIQLLHLAELRRELARMGLDW